MLKVQVEPGFQKFTNSLGLLLLRLCFGGLLLVFHGFPKLLTYTEKASTFPDPLGVGPDVSMALTIFTEVVCAILVMLGVYVRVTAALVAYTMLTGFFVVYAQEPWAKKEFALMYAIPFVVLVLMGSGDFSVMKLKKGKSKAAAPHQANR